MTMRILTYNIIALLCIAYQSSFAQSCPIANPCSIRSTISFDDGNGNPASYGDIFADGDYHIIHGLNNGNNIIKPFFIVEGWDPTNGNDFDYYTELYNDLIAELTSNDYDVIILNYEFAGDYIQKNAFLLVELIQQINSMKTQNNEGVFEQNTVMGYSMGGLVARYALAYMEANNIEHETQNFASHDSPQMGANVPLSIQFLINDLANAPLVWLVAAPTLYNFLNDNPSAKQMLIYYYKDSEDGVPTPNGLHTTFFDELHDLSPDNLGFPTKTKNIGLSNGSRTLAVQTNNDANGQLDQGDELVYFKRADKLFEVPVCCRKFLFICTKYCMEPVYGVIEAKALSGFTDDLEVDLDILGDNANSEHDFASGYNSYDHVSGSFEGILEDLNDALDGNVDELNIAEQFTFIPTTSALHIGSDDPLVAVGNDISTASCQTPFDVVYAEVDNEEHFLLSNDAKDFILDEIGAISSTTLFTQESLVQVNILTLNNPERKILCASDRVELSVDLDECTNCRLPEDNGEVTLNSGSALTAYAGNQIILKEGFHAKSGSNFYAKSGGTWDNHDISCYTPPTNGNTLANARTAPEPDSVNENDTTDYSQYVIIYPNPNSGSFTIEIDFDLELVERIDIANDYQELVYSNDSPQSTNNITISNPKLGFHYVIIVIDGNIVSKKIIVQ